MAIHLLNPESETHYPDSVLTWSPSAGTRVGDVTDDLDSTFISEVTDGHYITYAIEASPDDLVECIKAEVILRSSKNSGTAYLDVSLLIADVAQGDPIVSTITDTFPDFGVHVLNQSEWNGPWTKAQSDTIKVKIESDWAKGPQCGVSELSVRLTYRIGNEMQTTIEDLTITRDGSRDGYLATSGGVPGTLVIFASGQCGIGEGQLLTSSDGTTLSWKAPGSSAFGEAVTIGDAGDYDLRDGDDTDAWIRVSVWPAHVQAAANQVAIDVWDPFNSAPADDDVTAEEADSGDVETYTFEFQNETASTITGLVVWLHADTDYLEISANGSDWYAPTIEGSGVSLGDLDADEMATLYVRRTIPATTSFEPEQLSRIVYCFTSDSVKRYGETRGLYRIFNEAGYNLRRADGSIPDITDPPYTFAASLPATPDQTFADGDWYITMTAFDGVYESEYAVQDAGGRTYRRIVVDSGEEAATPPRAPYRVTAVQAPDGAVLVEATYNEAGANRADQWAIGIEVGGGDPAEDSPDDTQNIGRYGVTRLRWVSASQTHGATVKVRVQVRRNDGTDAIPVWVYSDGSSVLTVTSDAQGPTVSPAGGATWL